ncbi:GNAT family N-acetyltransferase [Stakelama pacifica]|uniref:Ribosomal protein S18 acetylase RimI-like enzyme n=1 Tax=Stakelama pacifica TaxID=517720 RepID=A0A4R6FUD4_9SPHN|nr:GNAT family N-acetyltransferase [Stakelama pacifica]TDN84544.1 ribosomal protein S18 acetylase RimI-like enzyme [Stakelama pacifica]GGO93501.1 N-acetyltransferase [Stakelama pacifica]
MGLIAVPPGEVATIVTTLEMTRRPLPAPIPDSPLRLVRWPAPRLDAYRTLFRRVGAPWLWFSRLVMADSELAAIVEDAKVEVFAVTDRQGIEVGLLELDFREGAQCELSFFALVPELAGKGHGRWLMAHALSLGWRSGIERLWVHTCTLDHPRALRFYRKSGFEPLKQTIETFADPRLTGHLPRESAPHVPLFDPASRR